MTEVEYYRVIDELVKYTNKRLIKARSIDEPSKDEPVNSAAWQIFREKFHNMTMTQTELSDILMDFLTDEEIMNKFDITDK